MIYPQNNVTASGAAMKRIPRNSGAAAPSPVAAAATAAKKGAKKQFVQWKLRNVKEGIVIVDEQQLSKLIKKEPIEKFYKLDPEPFASGMFATVRRAVSRQTGVVYAAKFSSRARYGDDCSREIHHEIALLSLCAPSQRIVRLHDVFETKTEIIILMEFAPGGDLQTIIDDNLVPFEADVVNFVRQLVEGLAYLHERKIAHLDIKPQNLVMMGDFPNCDVKLCDFEISRVILDGTEIREILGTPDYVAPEILHYEPITLAADMWSLGVTTYVLLTGFSPFGGETDQETFCNISRAQLDFPEELFEDVSKDAQDFMQKLLARDPKDRPNAKELLRHPWLSNKTPNRSADSTKLPGNEANRSNMSQKNLRKYLSKSREALFERVVQQQQQQGQRRGNDLRKTTLLSQSNKTRLCESHMSLVSKSREASQWSMSPSFSRSREKLYGLRSLSKSHEGLDLLKMSTQSVEGQTSPRAYARATTADLSMLPLLRLQEMEETKTSNTSLDEGNDNDKVELPQDLEEQTTVEKNEATSEETAKSSVTVRASSVPSLINPTFLLKCKTPESSPNITVDGVDAIHHEKIIGDFRIDNYGCQSEIEKKLRDLDDNKHKLALSGNKENSESNLMLESPSVVNVMQKRVQQRAERIECGTTQSGGAESVLESPKVVAQVLLKDDEISPKSELCIQNAEDVQSNFGTDSNESDVPTPVQKPEEDEPSFSVAQLISAYNRHQEIVTKSSLEVTMTANEKDLKLPPLIVEDPQTKFPTGPTALRLFIPNIDIEPSRKTKKNRTKSYRCLSRSSTQESIKSVQDVTHLEEIDGSTAHGEVVPENSKPVSTVCNFILASPGNLVSQKLGMKSTNYMRSASLSSEASATSGCYTSESSGSLSWEEVASPLSFTGKEETQKTLKTKKDGGDPWKKLCNGSYTRAMEKFGDKKEDEKETPVRKCSLTMMTHLNQDDVEERVRRKSTSTMKN